MDNKKNVYFTVRDGFGDNIGEAQYPTFEAALDKFNGFCNSQGADADGAMLGIVVRTDERDYKCVLVQNECVQYVVGNPAISRLRPMHNNISQRALAIPEIELAAMKAKQLVYPFDEQTQNRIDELEKELGLFERDVKTAGDLYVGKWRVHIVETGGRYGLNNKLVNKDPQSMIEFWDMSAKKSAFPDGQFVSRYDVETLFDTKWGPGPEALMRGGLCLDYSNRDVWSVSGTEMIQVFDWLKNRELMPGENYWRFSGEVDVPIDVVDRIPLPHIDSAYTTSEVVLNQILNGLPFVRDLHVERMGEYENGTGFTFSFSTQADTAQVLKALSIALASMPHEVYFDKKVVPIEKEPLDKVIRSCEGMNKKPDGLEKGIDRNDREER